MMKRDPDAKKIVLTVSLCLFLCTSFSLPGCKSSDPSRLSDSKPLIREDNPSEGNLQIQLTEISFQELIVVGKAELKPLYKTLTSPAEVSADLGKFAKVHARLSGKIDKISAWLGDRVARGEPLVSVRSMEMERIIGEFLLAKASYEEAKKNYERIKQLRAERIVSERALLANKKQFLSFRAALKRAKGELKLLDFTDADFEKGFPLPKDRSTFVVRTPISGIVTGQPGAILGAEISPQDELYQVLNTDSVWIFASIDPQMAEEIAPNTIQQIHIPGKGVREGRVTYISRVLDQKTRTAQVRLKVDNIDDTLRPGEFVEVSFSIPLNRSGVVIPQSALFRVGKDSVVFVRLQSGFAPKNVLTGETSGGLVEIRKGLTAGEEIVTQGGYYLKALILKKKMGAED